MAFDLSAIKDVASADVELVHPVTKAPLGAAVTVAGPEHPKRKKLRFDQQRRVRARIQKAGKLVLDDPEADAEEALAFLVGCTLGWHGISENGQPLAFSEAEARRLYSDERYAWLREQVMVALEDRELFIATSGAA